MILNIETKNVEPDVTVVAFTGRIALGRESQRIEPLVEELLRSNAKKIVFDLSGVDFIDSAGMGAVVSCFGKTRGAGGELRVAGAKERVLHVFQLARLDSILPFFATTAEACAGMAGPAPTS